MSEVHRDAIRFSALGYDILLIGARNHDEVVGTLGQVPADRIHLISSSADIEMVQVNDPTKVVWLTQTTLAVDESRRVAAQLRQRFLLLADMPSDSICYAAQNRQSALLRVAEQAEHVIVVGSANSHNTLNLVQVCERAGTPARLVEDAEQVVEAWLHGTQVVGVTAGASAPEALVSQLLVRLADYGFDNVRTVSAASENQMFALPRELAELATTGARADAFSVGGISGSLCCSRTWPVCPIGNDERNS